MCLYTRQLKPNIATKDIVCYKIVEEKKDCYITPYTRTRIPKEGIIYAEGDNNPILVCSGNIPTWAVSEGYIHAYQKAPSILYPKHTIIKCTIPKGAHYYVEYYTTSSHICADRIIIHPKTKLSQKLLRKFTNLYRKLLKYGN